VKAMKSKCLNFVRIEMLMFSIAVEVNWYWCLYYTWFWYMFWHLQRFLGCL